MKILAILQNQWFKEPARIKRLLERRPKMRNQLIGRFLFAGCPTGRRLQTAFGKELCNQIIWEEASPEIGGFSRSVFPADHAHIAAAIAKHQPEVIIGLGKVAEGALLAMKLDPSIQVLYGPHPATPNAIPALKALAGMLKQLV